MGSSLYVFPLPTRFLILIFGAARLAFAQARPDLCQAIFKHVAKAEDLTYTAAKECMDYFKGTEQVSMVSWSFLVCSLSWIKDL